MYMQHRNRRHTSCERCRRMLHEEDNMVMRNTMPGDELIITTNGETMACKVVKVMGTNGVFEEPIVPKNQIGDMHVKITINKDEILRHIEEIQKKELAAVTRDDVLEKFRELFPCWPIGSINDIRLKQMERTSAYCCAGFKAMVKQGIFGEDDHCRNGGMWILGKSKWQMTLCPFCGKKL